MPRSYSHLWDSCTSWANLTVAYRNCLRRKRFKDAALRFAENWESELLTLQRELRDRSYLPGVYRNFRVFEPKERWISDAPFRDRVVHHALVQILEPIFEPRLVFDTYACRKGKGTHRCLLRAQTYLRRYRFYLKTDIVKFFPNIDHAILIDGVKRHVRDRDILWLVQQLLDHGLTIPNEIPPKAFEGDTLLDLMRPRGLPIGNLTSQFFANIYLNRLDHWIKEAQRIPGYVRYCDDLILFDDSRERLEDLQQTMELELMLLRLRMHENKTEIRSQNTPVNFLGYRLSTTSRRLQQDALRRFRRRLRHWRWLRKFRYLKRGTVTRSLVSWQGHARFANSTGVKRDLWKGLRFTRKSKDR